MAGNDLKTFVEACRARRGTYVAGELQLATSEFLDEAARNPELLRQAAAQLDGLSPPGAAWMALTFGTSIERGSDVELTAPPLLAYFASQLALFPDIPPDDHSDPNIDASAEQAELIEAFPTVCQSVVAHLARSPQRRAALAREQALLDRLEELQHFGPGATWVREALLKTSGTLIERDQSKRTHPLGKVRSQTAEEVARQLWIIADNAVLISIERIVGGERGRRLLDQVDQIGALGRRVDLIHSPEQLFRFESDGHVERHVSNPWRYVTTARRGLQTVVARS